MESRGFVLPMLEAQARKRQLAQLKQGNETPVPEKIPEREGEAREQAAAMLGTNPRGGAASLPEKIPEPTGDTRPPARLKV